MYPSPRRITELTGTVFGISGLVMFGLVSGADLLTVTIDVLSVHVAFFEGSLSVAGFTAFVVGAGGYVLWGVWRGDPETRVTTGP